MSAQLGKEASSLASPLSVLKLLFRAVPPIPSTIDLAGKTVLVTGSNVGLGLECTRHFLKLHPSRVIMAVRSVQKGEAAAAGLRAEFPDAKIDVWQLDMASFRSVQAFAARCEAELDRLHVAVLNAGLGKAKFERVEEGRHRETTLQVNYLATALLAILLVPKMKPTASSSGPGRLTIVSSDASLQVKLDVPKEGTILDSLDRPEKFSAFGQYAVSKLLVTMFTAKLAEAVNPDDIIINCTNPSATKGTGFAAALDSRFARVAMGTWLRLSGRPVADAAKIYVHSSVVLGKESHGSYTMWDVRPWPVTMYTEQGQRITDRVWKETLQELDFAGLDKILEGSKH